MSEFYLIKVPNAAQVREIHRSGCTVLPLMPGSNATVHYIGSYSNKRAAFNDASQRFSAVDYCPQCIK